VAKIDYQIADQVDSGYRVTLNDGQILDVELVVSAIGLQAATELALTAGIACDKGIKVDKHLATNVASIYALGDAIEIDGQLMPYIAPIYWGIQALAKTLTGTRSEVNYPLMTVMVKTPTCPLSLLPVPVGIEGNWQIDSEDDGMVARFIDQKGRLQGFVLQGDKLDLRAQLLDQIK
jgi:rubredoxin-NAD+ reductase